MVTELILTMRRVKAWHLEKRSHQEIEVDCIRCRTPKFASGLEGVDLLADLQSSEVDVDSRRCDTAP